MDALIYIANVRIPTEKAHGYQIVRMCEAFAGLGMNVTLVHPRRRQVDPALDSQSVFDYYGVRPGFAVRTLPNWDILALEGRLPASLISTAFFLHGVLWGLYAVWAVRHERRTLYFTRDARIAFWLAVLNRPTVYEAHSIPRGIECELLRWTARLPALRLAVALTAFLRDRLEILGFPRSRLVVLPDAVDPVMFEGLPAAAECRARLGLPPDRPVIGYVGRFQTLGMEKGIPELVEAMRSLAASLPLPPLLVCVGGPMDRVPAYLTLADRLGVSREMLRFVDRVPNREVPCWMRACDVVTIPWGWTEFSAYFTSPMKLFEYMAAGVPIVASDLPAVREILRHGANAWLVAPGDPGALADGICRILSDAALAGRLAANARADCEGLTWEKRARAVLEASGRI